LDTEASFLNLTKCSNLFDIETTTGCRLLDNFHDYIFFTLAIAQVVKFTMGELSFSPFYFSFLFSCSFIFLFFLFLEQLRLRLIGHAVTSVTTWWRSHQTDHKTWENLVENSRTDDVIQHGHHMLTSWTTHGCLG